MISHRAQKPEKETTPGDFLLLHSIPCLYSSLSLPRPSYLFFFLSAFFSLLLLHNHLPQTKRHTLYLLWPFFLQSIYFFHFILSDFIFLKFLLFFLVWTCTSLSVELLLCTCADACKLQVKPLEMSPRHRNVKIIQGTLCRQCRRPIWTSSHLAESRPLLEGSTYQSFWIYWCAAMSPLPLYLQFISLSSLHPLSDVFDFTKGSVQSFGLGRVLHQGMTGTRGARGCRQAGIGPWDGWSPAQRLNGCETLV